MTFYQAFRLTARIAYALVADGVVYVGSADGYLYAIE
jgi:outer membrane protein assembly factor BamB